MNKTWICDNCGQPIKETKDGYVEWLVRGVAGEKVGRGLRLVHHKAASPLAPTDKCQYNEKVESLRDGSILHDESLDYFLGQRGKITLSNLTEDWGVPEQEVTAFMDRLG